MTDDLLVAWLTSALDEIKRVARAAECPYGPWEHPHEDDGELNEVTIFPERGGAIIVATTTANDEGRAEAAHIALHDPRSALARVEAERAVTALHRPSTAYGRPLCEACWGEEPDDSEPWPCSTIRWLAHGHRHDIPGWRTEWAPEGVSADA